MDGQKGSRSTATAGSESGSVTRRGVLLGSAGVAATLALGACAGPEVDAGGSSPTASGSGGSQATTGTPVASSSGSAGASLRLVGTGDFPVGGGAVVGTDSGPVVVTHPDDDEFLAFSGRCPHAGCTVKEVTENVVLCDCHGSTFDGSTGDRLDGPAPKGLSPVAIKVEGDGVYLA